MATVVTLLLTQQSLHYTAEAATATREQIRLAEQGQITDRFAQAVEMLGHDKVDVRIGAVLALERIMHDAVGDAETVVAVLAEFIRSQSPAGSSSVLVPATPGAVSAGAPDASTPVRRDVVAAFAAVARRPNPAAWNRPQLAGCLVLAPGADLREAHLGSVWMRGADLRGADLHAADLSNADLRGARLQEAFLSDTNLIGTFLDGADLTDAGLEGARLGGANLVGAVMRGAGMSGAELFGADLTGADLRGANFDGAELLAAQLGGTDLRGTNLGNVRGLTADQLIGATIDYRTSLPPSLRDLIPTT